MRTFITLEIDPGTTLTLRRDAITGWCVHEFEMFPEKDSPYVEILFEKNEPYAYRGERADRVLRQLESEFIAPEIEESLR